MWPIWLTGKILGPRSMTTLQVLLSARRDLGHSGTFWDIGNRDLVRIVSSRGHPATRRIHCRRLLSWLRCFFTSAAELLLLGRLGAKKLHHPRVCHFPSWQLHASTLRLNPHDAVGPLRFRTLNWAPEHSGLFVSKRTGAVEFARVLDLHIPVDDNSGDSPCCPHRPLARSQRAEWLALGDFNPDDASSCFAPPDALHAQIPTLARAAGSQ